MAELKDIKADILVTEALLATAVTAGDRDLILTYTNYLTELDKTKNLLLTGPGNLLIYGRSMSTF